MHRLSKNVTTFFSIFIFSTCILAKEKLIGQSNLYVFIWHIYDIQLYSTTPFSFNKPFRLVLHYKKSLTGEEITEHSTEQMEEIACSNPKQSKAWDKRMRTIFPNIDSGDTLTGSYQPNGATLFYKNKNLIGRVDDPAFGRCFFGIWLDPKTTEPKLRNELLGETS